MGSCDPRRWTRRFVVAKVGRRLQFTDGPAKIFYSTAPFLLAYALQDQELRSLNLLGCSGGVHAQKEHSAALSSWHEADRAGAGAKVRSRISGESEPPVRRASEVTERLRFRINSDEHDAEHGVRSGPGQPLAPEQRDKPGASILPTNRATPENSKVM